jgi:hypothetical protein
MDPEVPQALRLQAILASGIVKVHEKKVNYLKEDAEHAMVCVFPGPIQNQELFNVPHLCAEDSM